MRVATCSRVNTSAGTQLYFTNNYTLLEGAQFLGAGLVDQTAGTLTANGAIRAAAFTWSGGNWNAAANSGLTTTIAAGTVLNLTAGHDSYRDFSGRGIVNQGVVNWQSAYLRGGNGSSFTNAAGATFNDQNASGYTIHNPFGGTFAFTNAGTYVKSTSGTTQVQVPFTNTGTLLAQAGTLAFTTTFTNTGGSILAAGGNFSFSGGIDVGTGTLGGTGTITGNVTAAGNVSPGSSPGQLTIAGNLTLASTSRLLIELGGTNKGVNYDFLNVTGTAQLGGELRLSFVNGFQNAVPVGAEFVVVTAASLANPTTFSFSNVAPGQRLLTTDGFGSFQVDYGSTSAFPALTNSVVLSNFVAVPEPSTYGMLSLGAVAVFASWRRRRR